MNAASQVKNMTATNLALPKLQHVTVTFPPGEESRLRDFYINVLGFKEKPVPKVVKPLGWIWFHTGAGGVELHTVPDTTPLPKDPTHHFCIEVDDLDRYRSALTQAGYEIREARALPFRPRFFTWDPFRNLIEIVHIEGDYVSAGEAG
jgi:catechol 2,3-dioxygenase-like lactoylglutathione lyase family enzyme